MGVKQKYLQFKELCDAIMFNDNTKAGPSKILHLIKKKNHFLYDSFQKIILTNKI